MKLDRGRRVARLAARRKPITVRTTMVEALEVRWLLAIDLSTTPLPAYVASGLYFPNVEIDRSDNTSQPNGSAGPTGLAPAQVAHAYGYDQILFSGGIVGTGAGQTIAIVDAYDTPTIAHDLAAFDAFYGIAAPPSFIRVAQDGSTHYPTADPAGPGGNNWEVETALDVEWSHALAPQANILLVEANTNGIDLRTATNFARNYPGVSVVSMSFGSAESFPDDSLYTTPAGHTPITFIASTGDNGAPGEYPAYSPNVLAVGGTTLTLNSSNNISSETGWSGSGGGISTQQPSVGYQSGVVTQSTVFRTTPDVSFDANPATGASIYDSYNNGTTTPWTRIGGTSFSAPSWAALIAIADQGRATAGLPTLDGRSGTLPALYGLPSSDFHDILSGSNGFNAGAGYDLVTGRGSPVANLIAPALVTASNLSGTVFSDANNDGVLDNNETGLAGWTVFDDLNGNGVLDPPAVTTTAASIPSPLAIPDGSGSLVSTLTVGGLAGSIMDLNVNLTINHTRDSNLGVTLISPSGVSVVLINHGGGNGANYTNTTFDDQSGTAISSGAAPFTGSFRPSGTSLASFTGLNAQGTWQLVVTDTVTGNTGTLVNWSLSILTASEPTTTTDGDGVYLFRNAAPGTYNIVAIPPTGFTQTAPASGSNVVTLTTGMNVAAQDFAELGSSVSGEMYIDSDGDGALDPGEIALPWAVYDDLNNNGQYDSTSVYTVNSNSTPQTVADMATTLSTAVATGLAGAITDINVSLTLHHTNDSDLNVTLISPDGTYVPLINHSGGSGANFINTTLDDQAIKAIGSGTAPFTGSFKPASVLSALNGKNPNGTWKLLVSDTVSGNSGTLDSWSLKITTNAGEPFDLTGNDGLYQFANLTAGTHTIRQLPTGYSTLSSPASGAYTINVTAPITVTGDNFGNISQVQVSAGGPYTISQGQPLTLSGLATGGDDPYNYSWDLNGDGVYGDATGASPTLSWAQLEALGIGAAGTLNVRLSATDSNNEIGDSTATTLTIIDVPPVVSISGPTTALRGETNTYTLTANDVNADELAGFKFTINWGDGSPAQIITALSGTQVTHGFNVAGQVSVAVTAVDQSGGVSQIATQVVHVDAEQLRPDTQNPSLVDLVWGGSGGADVVQFNQISGTTIRIHETQLNGAAVNNTLDFTGITGRVVASGNNGNDVLDARGLLTTQATFDGGFGNNTIYGGSAGDILIGGSNGGEGKQGSNVIIAGNGNNTIYGNSINARKGSTGGANLIIGGTGNDTIYGSFGPNPTGNGGEGGQNLIVGNGGNDTIYASQITDGAEGGHGSILIGDTTTLNLAALQSILAEWTSTDTLAVKVADISGTGNTTGANSTNYLQPGVTVVGDGAADQLYSDTNGKPNWLFLSPNQDVGNRVKTADVETFLSPPSITVPASPLTISSAIDLPISGMSVADSALLSNTSNVQLTLAANSGFVELSTNVAGGLQSSQISNNDSGTVTITAPLAAINATLAAAGGVLYCPVTGFAGTATLTATISDLGNTVSGIPQTVSSSTSIHVMAPVLSPPAASAGVAISNVPVFHFSNSDPSATAANYSALVTLGDGHTVTLTGTPGPNGQIVATGNGGFDVQLSYTYGGVISGQTFAVTVTDQQGQSATASTNNFAVTFGPPSVVVPDNLGTITAGLGLPISGISVADGGLLSSSSNVQLSLATAHGKINLSTTVAGGLQSNQITSNGTGNVTITAPLSAINATLAATGGVIYTAASGYSGTDTLGVTMSDLGNTISGLPQTTTGSASISVAAPVLSPPVAIAGVPFTNVVVFHFTDSDPTAKAANYTATITLGDGNRKTLTSTAGANGQIVANVNGGFDVQLSYTYGQVLTGQTFSVTVTDQGGRSATASAGGFSVTLGPPSVTLPTGPLTIKQTLDLPIAGLSVADASLSPGTSTVQLTLTVTGGTIAVSTVVSGGLQSSQIAQNGTGTVTITAPLAALNATLTNVNGVIYTPNASFTGTDTLDATVSDQGHTISNTPQTATQSVAINVTTGTVTPADVPGLQLWLDPTDLSTLNLRSSAYLVGSSQQSLNTAAGTSSYNFATHSEFSFAGWVYFNNTAGDTFSSSQVIIAQSEIGGGNGVFSLSLTGGAHNALLQFSIWTGKNSIKSVYTASGPGGTAFSSGHDYFIAVKFDGSQATDGGKLSIWVDGTQLPILSPNGTVLPSTLQNDTASTDKLTLGNAGATTNMSMRLEDWGVWDNVAFNQSDINSLWSGGAGLTITAPNQLPDNSAAGGSNLASPTMYWALTESAGIRNDISGNGWNLTPSSNDNSTVGNKLQVISWTDKSGVLGTFYAGDGPAAVFQMKRMREPTYDPNALGTGSPGVIFGQWQWLYNGTPGWMANSATGAIFQNVVIDQNLTNNEDFFLSSSADTDSQPNAERIFMPGYDGPSNDNVANVYTPMLRINDTAGNGTGYGNQTPHASIMNVNYSTKSPIAGNYYLSPGEHLSFEWADIDAIPGGGAVQGAWRSYVNGAQQQVYVSDGGAGSAPEGWTQLASGRSAQMLNGFYDNGSYQSFTTLGSTTVYGDVLAYGVANSPADGAVLRAMMMQRAGLTGLLSPLQQTVNTKSTTYITSSNVAISGTTSTLVMPPVVAAANLQAVINNGGSGAATINADAGTDIVPAGGGAGQASISLAAGQSVTLVSDGTNWNITVGPATAAVASAAVSSMTAASTPGDASASAANTSASASATDTLADDSLAMSLLTAAPSAVATSLDLHAIGWASPDALAVEIAGIAGAMPATGSTNLQSGTPLLNNNSVLSTNANGLPGDADSSNDWLLATLSNDTFSAVKSTDRDADQS
ncbi:MAG TPA: proprotein convertase P-domain-containing protein [Pirellulales bacterium]|jgi:subtilisin-like proprotein convertase family protein